MADEHPHRAKDMARVVELESDFLVIIAEIAEEIAALAQRASHPGLLAKIDSAMCVERILHELQLLALARHDIHGIVQHDVCDIRRALGHENRTLRLPARQHRQ